MSGHIRIDLNSNDWRGSRLSNLSHSPFILDGMEYSSVEGFIRHLVFSEGDFRRDLCTELDGTDTVAMGYQALEAGLTDCHYGGRTFAAGSEEWERLVERAIRAKFEQHESSRRALRRTAGMELRHEGNPEMRGLDAELFLEILSGIREDMEDDDGG